MTDRLTLQDFADDAPWAPDQTLLPPIADPARIEGVEIYRLVTNSDGRGGLTVLGSRLADPDFSTPHVYLVQAAAKSIRAWVYHKRQTDQLAFAMGSFRVVLYDLRPGSATEGKLNVFDVGAANKVQLRIPPGVVHAVQNLSESEGVFVNMPTNHYDPANPDKSRLHCDDPRIPYRFD